MALIVSTIVIFNQLILFVYVEILYPHFRNLLLESKG